MPKVNGPPVSRAKKRILFVISSLRVGGTQKILATLASHLEDCGYEIHLATQAPPQSDEFLLRPTVRRHQFGYEENSADVLSALKNNLARIRKLRTTCLELKPDVIISFLGETNILTIIATRFTNTRLVVNERSNLRQESIGRIWHLLRRLTYRFATRVISNSGDSYSALLRYVNHSKLRLIANPIQIPSSYQETQRKSGENILLLTVSRCSKEKGIDVLLHAIKYIVDQGATGFSLRVVGDGPCLGELMSLATAMGLEEVVDWRGQELDVEKHYREADIFVLASRYEGMPNVLLEAAAHRIPLVVTESSLAVRRFINQNQNGILVPTESPEELGHALQRLIVSPKQRAVLVETGEKVFSEKSAEQILRQWEEALLDFR